MGSLDSVGLARVAAVAGFTAATLVGHLSAARTVPSSAPGAAAAATNAALLATIPADRDDDDVDGIADAEDALVPGGALADAALRDAPALGAVHAKIAITKGDAHVRVLGNRLQGVSPGHVEGSVSMGSKVTPVSLDVVGYGFRDGSGADIDPAKSHASLERTPPSPLIGDADATYDDPDALRIHVVQESTTAPDLDVQTYNEAGVVTDRRAHVSLAAVPCRAREAGGEAGGEGGGDTAHCFSSAPIRLVTDDTDRTQALGASRSLRAELGGALAIVRGGRKMQAIRILGPQRALAHEAASAPAGTGSIAIDRYRARVRPFVVRIAPGGAPALGGNDAGAIRVMRSELSLASATWSQCGVSLGAPADIQVHVVDPPPAYLLAFGDDAALPSSGGQIRFRVDSHAFAVDLPPKRSASAAADLVAAALTKAGLHVTLSPNARIAPAAGGSVDLEVHRASGAFASIDFAGAGVPLSTDATLAVRIGAVDLSDGLQHFGDVDSVAGTLEERTLLKSLDDGDPTTLEIVVIPFFGGGGRIGESFIGVDGSSLRNVVLLDRAGVRARRSSLTLAHEMGHVLLDIPGHPDDYGLDTPTSLMDSDAADASAFGPRRLSIAECTRMMHEAGPDARVPLLTSWPIKPIRYF